MTLMSLYLAVDQNGNPTTPILMTMEIGSDFGFTPVFMRIFSVPKTSLIASMNIRGHPSTNVHALGQGRA